MTSERTDKFRALMKGAGIRAALITSHENRFYLSGFLSSAGALLITENSLLLFTDSRYTIQAKQQAPLFSVTTCSHDMYALIGAQLAKEKIKSVWFEDEALSVAEFSAIKKQIKTDFVPMGNVLYKMRALKYRYEAEKIAEAARLADAAFSHVLSFIKKGVSENEVAAQLEGFMRRHGATKPSFDTICASGLRSAMPHGTATDKVIEKGDFVTMDFGCVLDGYCSDITRTVVVGRASARQKEIYNTVLYAQEKAVQAVMPNMEGRALDAVARDVITQFGYGENFGHSLGHGVGIEVHEKPNVSPSTPDIMVPGSVITIEPGIYVEGFGGVRIEDMVYVTEDGYRVLTSSPKKLIEL